MKEACWWEEMTLGWSLIRIQILERWNVTVIFVSTHWSFWHSWISILEGCYWDKWILLLFFKLWQRLFKSIIRRARICTSSFHPVLLIFPVIAHENLVVILCLLELAIIHCLIEFVFLILVDINWDLTVFCLLVWSIFLKRLSMCGIISVEVHGRLMHSIFILWHKALLLLVLLLLVMMLSLWELLWMLILLLESLGCFILWSISWRRILLASKLWLLFRLLNTAHIDNFRYLLWLSFWTAWWRVMSSLWLLSLALSWISWWSGRIFIHILRLLVFQLILWLMRGLIIWVSLRLSWAHLWIAWVHITHALVNSFSYCVNAILEGLTVCAHQEVMVIEVFLAAWFLTCLLVGCVDFSNLFDVPLDTVKICCLKLLRLFEERSLLNISQNERWDFF